MANNNLMFNVEPGFDIYRLTDDLVAMYQGKGMQVNAMRVGKGVCIDFNDGNDGFTKYIGLGANIKASFIMNGDCLNVSFTEADWSGKIVAFIIGWFLCWIPWVTGGIGIFKQTDLPKKISNDVRMLASNASQNDTPSV